MHMLGDKFTRRVNEGGSIYGVNEASVPSMTNNSS